MAVPAGAMPPPPPVAAKADLTKRFIAALIDGLLAGGVSMVPVIGGIVGAAYILLRDGLTIDFMDRRSIGKKLLKLRPVRADGQPMDPEASIKRNITLCIGAVGAIFWVIPILGWIIAILLGLVGLVVAVIEMVLVLTDQQGMRMGDKLAGTRVIEVNE
jgi:uncharacterized RDD family membrane protein YckC